MSCQIRLTANIQDIPSIRRCLYPTDDRRGTENWLQTCETSMSPSGDICVLAKDRRIVLLTSKWDTLSGLNQFYISYSGSIHDYDKVKSVLCLPIVGHNQNSHQIGSDWTCIMVGFDSGYVRFYTENCELLFEEQLHNENISSVKCQSQHSPRPDIHPQLYPEEIYVQYQTTLCLISGGVLFPILRTCRTQLAKKEPLNHTQITLNPKKWGFTEQGNINDSSVVGLNMSNIFDHLQTASICGGYASKYRAMPPNDTLVLAIGSKPFLGYHYAMEGGAQPVLSDVAKAVATKLKSALPTWLMGSKATAEKPMQTSSQPSEAMGCRFGLSDIQRTASSIILSPDKRLLALSDSLGRVLLIDAFKGIVLRIYKGYREAQCSFIQVPDESNKSKPKLGSKVALFLIIYSPKNGTLDIFTMKKFTKIATFTASKHSKLLFINYGLMGYTSTVKTKYVCQYNTIFIDSDGLVKEFMIPFHFSLAEKNNKRSRDLHLHKKLRQMIKSDDYELEKLILDAVEICKELKTNEIRLQTVELLLSNKKIPISATLPCIEYFENEAEIEDSNFKLLVKNSLLILKFYKFLTENEPNLDEINGNNENKETKLKLEIEEMNNLQKLLDLSGAVFLDSRPKVTFSDNKKFIFPDFLSSFLLNKDDCITLKENIDERLIFETSQTIFESYITNPISDFQNFETEVLKTKISTKSLFYLLIYYWVNRLNQNLEYEMNNFHSVVQSLVKISNKDTILTDPNNTSIFWTDIRNILGDSAKPFPALTAAILCKKVAQKCETDMEGSINLDEEENLEILTQENVQWSILIGKLEDISILNIILSKQPYTNDIALPKLKYEDEMISLKYVLEKGKGSVSELVAKWLCKSGTNPQSLVINDYLCKDVSLEEDSKKKIEYSEDLQEKVRNQIIFIDFNRLKAQFPHSLDCSSILANMSWEFSLAWQKTIEKMDLLEASIKCLDYIIDIKIKHGMYSLIWQTRLKVVFESVAKLINKVGKLPKERLCRQDTNLSDYQISIFISITTQFLSNFMDLTELSIKHPDPILRFEAIWENSPKPLVQLALDQKNINYTLLNLHFQLSLMLQMITTFSIKHSKILNNLFESSTVNSFFTSLNSNVQVNSNRSDLKLNTNREQFLLKVISASLETVTINDKNGQIYSNDHVKWMANCLLLARMWNLEVEVLKKAQVVQLYHSGFDVLAEELLAAVNEREAIGVELLNIAARRLKQYLASEPDLAENISALCPQLTMYMDILNEEWCSPTSINAIYNLASRALECISENMAENKIVYYLLEACKTLQEIKC